MGLNKKIWIALLVLIFGFLAAGAFVWKRYIRAPWDDEYAYTKGCLLYTSDAADE